MKAASLSARVTLLLLTTSVLMLGGGSLVMDHRIDHELQQRFQQSLHAQAQSMVAAMEIEPWHVEPDAAAWQATGLLGDSQTHFYSVRCGDRELSRSLRPPPTLPAAWPGDDPHAPTNGEQRLPDGRRLGWETLAFRMPLGEGWGRTPDERERRWQAQGHGLSRDCRLLLVQDRSRLDELMRDIDWILALGPALSLGIALFAVPLLVRRGLRPLHALGERMAGIGPSAPGQRLAATGVRELDPLVARFNQVLERMDEGLTRERRFAGGLAHETRTRLAELRILCEVESRYPTGRPQADLLDELGRIGAELEATVQALLLLTRLQAGIERPRWHEVEPAALLERLAQRLRPEAARRGVQLRIDIDEPNLPWRSDAALLEVVLGNLLGNACYYAPAGDTVRVRLRGRELSIDNAAPSLDVEDLRHFGQHFWRKQLPDSGHSGLGLALVSAAARALDLSLDYRLTDGRLHVRIIGAPKTDDDAHSPA